MSEAAAPPGFADIGARLRGARERAGLNVAQAAERLHCDRGLIDALEAGRFAQIGAPVFVRGHLRRYAELLGEPVGEILELWERESAGQLAAPDLTRIPKPRRPPDAKRLLVPAAGVVLVALFAVLISWVLRDAPLPPASDSAAGPVLDGPAAGAAAQGGSPPPPPADQPVVAAADVNPAADAPSGEPGPAAQTQVTLPGASGDLRIRAAADCWVEVYDAQRRQLYFNLLRAGGAASVRGRMPLRVLLGNVGGVTLEFEGRQLTVPRELQRANTARVLLGADGVLRAAPRD